MNKIAYIHATDNNYGMHQYEWNESDKAVPGPASFVHGHRGYVARALKDWVAPEFYTDTGEECTSSIRGVLAAIISTDASIVYILNLTIMRAIKEWLPSWHLSEYKTKDGADVKDHDLWPLLHERITNGLEVELSYDKDPGMVRAKLVCNIWSIVKKNSIQPYLRKYWSNPITRNSLLAYSHLCFNTFTHKTGAYLIADCTDGIYDIGKRTNGVAYSVVLLNKPDEHMENIHQVMVPQTNHSVIGWASMDRIYNKDTTRDIQEHQGVLYQHCGHRYDIHFAGDNALIVGEVKPIGLVRRGLATFDELLRVLKVCGSTSEVEAGERNQTMVNITAYIRKGKKLLPSLPLGAAHITLPHPIEYEKKMQYKLGKSLPNRNKLAALARENADFWLVTWNEVSQVTRHAIYVRTSSGQAIYSSYNTDVVI